jgi:hypothetical protein
MVVVGCGQVCSVVSGWGRTENPRVGGSIPPLAILRNPTLFSEFGKLGAPTLGAEIFREVPRQYLNRTQRIRSLARSCRQAGRRI